jgi:hypothetical protein
MLITKGLPKNLWAEAVSYAMYIRARSPTRALHNKTPMEAWTGIKPDVSNLHEFGSNVWVLDEGDRSKLDPKANKFLFVGIEEGPRAIRYYNPKTHKILISQNFKFNNSPNTPSQVNLDLPIPSGNSNSDLDSAQIEGEPQEPETHDTNSPHNPISSLEPTLPTRRGLRERKTINYTKLHNPGMRKEIVPTQQNKPNELSPVGDPTDYVRSLISGEKSIFDEPNTLKDVKKSPDWPQWEKAIQSELQMLQEKGTWRLESLPADRQAIGNHWTFKKKFDVDRNLS